MKIETRNLGSLDGGALEDQARRALEPALDRFRDRVRRVRVRFLNGAGHDATCRVRVWCGRGPTIVVEQRGASHLEAVHAAADVVHRSLRRRWSYRRARRRRSSLRSGVIAIPGLRAPERPDREDREE